MGNLSNDIGHGIHIHGLFSAQICSYMAISEQQLIVMKLNYLLILILTTFAKPKS